MNSPSLKGRSKYIINPPNKLDKRSFAAKPTTKPPTPPKAKSPDTLKPNSCIKIKDVIINTITLIILIKISYV